MENLIRGYLVEGRLPCNDGLSIASEKWECWNGLQPTKRRAGIIHSQKRKITEEIEALETLQLQQMMNHYHLKLKEKAEKEKSLIRKVEELELSLTRNNRDQL